MSSCWYVSDLKAQLVNDQYQFLHDQAAVLFSLTNCPKDNNIHFIRGMRWTVKDEQEVHTSEKLELQMFAVYKADM